MATVLAMLGGAMVALGQEMLALPFILAAVYCPGPGPIPMEPDDDEDL
jgi:hypothetical protein